MFYKQMEQVSPQARGWGQEKAAGSGGWGLGAQTCLEGGLEQSTFSFLVLGLSRDLMYCSAEV